MTAKRGPFQGVLNIIRFNWHFYVLAGIFVLALIILPFFLPQNNIGLLIIIFCLMVSSSIFISLATSYYIYDLSNLYTLNWLDHLTIKEGDHLANINAGFDETSVLLKERYPNAQLSIFDFYDPTKHTEVSIERARKAYPAYPGTKIMATHKVPLIQNSTDVIF